MHLPSRRIIASATIASLLSPIASCTEPRDERPPATSTTSSPLLATTAPMLLPGSGGVTDRGTAAYSLPLRAPDGPNGMAPALSLEYIGASASNGALGVGFALRGLSSIVPCRFTFAADRYTDGPDFVAFRDDAYCLDGARLVPVDITGSVFHTEIETHQRVVASGDVNGAQPTGFTVYSRDGGIREYEPVYGRRYANRDAQSTPVEHASPIAVLYRIRQATDRNGNKLVYHYESTDLLPSEIAPATEVPKVVASRLERIDYAFDTANQPTRQIVFGYTRRYEELVEYRWGVKVVLRSVMNDIAMNVLTAAPPSTSHPPSMVTAWRYALSYEASPDTKRTRMTGVVMRDSASVSSWRRTFGWTTSQATSLVEHAIPSTGPTDRFDAEAMSRDDSALGDYLTNGNWVRPNDTRLVLFDVDGDGDDDALYRTRRSGLDYHMNQEDGVTTRWYEVVSGNLRMRISGNGQPLAQSVHDLGEQLEPGLRIADLDDISGTEYRYSFIDLGKSRIGDLDGDGHVDLMLARTDIDETYVEAITYGDDNPTTILYSDKWEYGFTTYPGYARNGLLEAPFTRVAPTRLASLWGVLWSRVIGDDDAVPGYRPASYQRLLADMDGDGRVDVVDPFYPLSSGPMDLRTATWNLEDAPEGRGLYTVALSSREPDEGEPPVTPLPLGFPWVCGNGFANVADIEGDGRHDVLVAGAPDGETGATPDTVYASGVYRELSVTDQGIALPDAEMMKQTSALGIGSCAGDYADLVFGDFNGDGLTDVLYPPGSYRVSSPLPNQPPVPNPVPLVRWNLGTGFGPVMAMPVHGVAASLMNQPTPIGRQGTPVRWDRGTRVADIDRDGRSDIIAVREDLEECVSPFIDDLLIQDDPTCTNRLVVFRSLGDSFQGQEVWSTTKGFANLAHGFTTSQLGDVTGDGALDFVTVKNQELVALELPWRTTPDLLASVGDSSLAGPMETFEYHRAWWGDAPRTEGAGTENATGTDCAWPNACPSAGATVVRAHRVYAGTTDNAAMYRTTLHRFTQPRINLSGRGSLGFGTHEIWERETGAWTKRVFANDRSERTGNGMYTFPYQSVPEEVLHVLPTYQMPAQSVIANEQLIAPGLANQSYPVVVTWTHHTFEPWAPTNPPSGIIRIDTPYTRTSVFETTARLTLSTFPKYTVTKEQGVGSRTETWRTFDDHGNVASESTEIRDGYGAGDVVKRELKTFYENRDMSANGEQWLLGLPAYTMARAYTPSQGGAVPNSVVRRTFDPDTGDIDSVTEAVTLDWACETTACETHYLTTELERDRFGNVELVSRTAQTTLGPQTRTASTTWDPSTGVYPTGTTDALDFTTSITLHPWFGLPTIDTDLNGVTTNRDYDGFGRLRIASRPGLPSLTRSYSLVQGKLRIDDELSDGSKQYAIHDDLGRVVTRGALGLANQWSLTSHQFDVRGNVIKTMLPTFDVGSASYTSAVYDRLGRPLTTTTPDHNAGQLSLVTRYTHGLLASSTIDPRGHITYVNRDPTGRVMESGHLVHGEAYGEVKFEYGPFDRTTRITDAAGNVTTIEFNAASRRLTHTEPDTGETRTTYDGFGQVIEKRLADGGIITNEYDLGGRLTTTTAPDGIRSRIYDATGAKGRLSMVTSPDDVDVLYGYDALGRLRTTVQNDGTSKSVVHRYDGQGRIRYTFYPTVTGQSRFVIRYDYNATNGYLTDIRDVSMCGVSSNENGSDPSCPQAERIWRVVERDARDQIKRATYGPSNLPEVLSYGPMGRLRSQSLNNAVTDYTYDADGLLASRSTSTRTEEFTHDALHRIDGWELRKPATTGGPALVSIYDYDFDELGNLELVTKGSTTQFTAEYGQDGRPHAIRESTQASSYTYDALGRQTGAGARTVDYNAFDLPVRISQSTNTRALRYDGDGQRVSRTSKLGSITLSSTRYLGRIYERRVPHVGDPTDVFYVYGDEELVAQVEYKAGSVTKRYAMGDHRGTPTMFTNGVPELQYFDPFGTRIASDGSAATDTVPETTRGFTGHESEDGSLINMQGRMYDAKQYRFLTPDPVVSHPLFGQSYNPYSYVLNSPLNLSDPTGFSGQNCDGGCPVDEEEQTEAGGVVTIPVAPPSPSGGAKGAGAAGTAGAGAAGGAAGTIGDAGGAATAGTGAIGGAAGARAGAVAPVGQDNDSKGGPDPWSAPAPAWEATKQAHAIGADERRSAGVRTLGYLGAALAAPFASVEMAMNAGANAILSVAKSGYESYTHYVAAYDLYSKGATEGALDQYLQARKADAEGAIKLALFIAGLGAAHGISTADNAAALAANMAGPRPWQWAAHHISPARMSNVHAMLSRVILRYWRIDINGAENGVYLPTVRAAYAYRPQLHDHVVHSAAYTRTLFRGLSRARTREEAVQVLGDMRRWLLNAGTP